MNEKIRYTLRMEYAISIENFTLLYEGYFNRIYRIVDENNIKLILKVYTKINEGFIENLDESLSVMMHFDGLVEGVNTPKVRLSKCNNKFEVFNGLVIIVFEYIEGITAGGVMLKDDDWDKVVELLIELHNSKELMNDFKLMKPNVLFDHLEFDLLRKINLLTKIDFNNKECGNICSKVSDKKVVITEALEKIKLPYKHIRSNNENLVIVHSDLTPNNIMRTDDGRIFILNWDDVCYDFPEKEFASLFNLRITSERNLIKDYKEKFKFFLTRYYRYRDGEMADSSLLFFLVLSFS